jgi:hypothetical protein
MDKKAKVKQELAEKTISEKTDYGTTVTTAMGGEAVFAPLAALIAVATAKTTALNTAKIAKEVAAAAAKEATDVQHDQEIEFDLAFTNLGNGVDTIAAGDKTIIDKAAMESFFPGKAPAIGELGQVLSFAASEGDNPGEIDLGWDNLKGANSYLIQIATPEPSGFTFSATSTKSQATISGLVSGTKYWFRVAGVGAAGQGPFSDPSYKVAP